MKRFLALAALAAVAAVVIQPVPARAFTSIVTIKNETNKCAWVTMYLSHPFILGWLEVENPEGKARWLHPGASVRLAMGDAVEMKIRAQVKKNVDCTGETIIDTYDVRKDNSGRTLSYAAELVKNDRGGYNLWFK